MDRTRGHGAGGFLAHRGLLAASAGGAMAEAALLAALVPSARVLAPQVTALAPLAVYHDLRWLYGYGLPWPAFSAIAVLLVAARSGISAGLIRLAWPAGAAPPPLADLLWSCATMTAFSWVFLSPVTALIFGTSVVPFSWPYLASLSAMVLLMVPISHGGLTRNWWETLPPLPAVCWLLADFLVLTGAAAVITRLPTAAAVPVAGAAGLVNARAWYGVADAMAPGRRHAPAHLPLAPLAAVTAIAAVIGATRLAFYVGVQQSRPHHTAAAAAGSAQLHRAKPGLHTVPVVVAPARTATRGEPAAVAGGQQRPRPRYWGRQAVLVIAGFGSSCCNHAGDVHRELPGWLVQQFSYRGLSRSGQPLPHGASASNIPLTLLGNRVTAQLEQLHAQTGRPVDVVAESEGTLGVDAMLALHPRVPLASVVLLSPIVSPGRNMYPAIAGQGMMPGAELRSVIWFAGSLSPFGPTGAQTFVDSVGSDGARFAAAARLHPVRSVQFLPLADAVTMPACRLPRNAVVVPAFHGELLGDRSVLTPVRDFLTHHPLPRRPGLATTAEVIAAGATAWRMPALAVPSGPCRA